jgi:dihydroneopterin aldolase
MEQYLGPSVLAKLQSMDDDEVFEEYEELVEGSEEDLIEALEEELVAEIEEVLSRGTGLKWPAKLPADDEEASK